MPRRVHKLRVREVHELKEFLSAHRKQCVITAVIFGVLVIGGIIAGLILHFYNNKDKEQVSELVDQIADLVNEPSSPDDEVYEGEKDETVSYRVRVNKTRNCVTVYKKDNDGEYTKAVKSFVCSVGYNAPLGTYETSDRYTWKIVNGNVWSQYATRITGNVLFHSVTYSEKSKSTLIAKYYNQLGMAASAGCIRLMVADAKWLMEHCPPGTEVEIYEDEDPGPLGKPISIIVSADEKWDPSDPDDANPWKGHEASLEGAHDRTVERGIGINYMEGLTAYDTIGNVITGEVDVETDLDYQKVGTYSVTYTLVDGVGSEVTETVEYTVVDTRAPYFSGIKKTMTAKLGDTILTSDLLKGVYVVDNNEILSNDRIQIDIPNPLVEGTNTITYTITDDYGNTATATTVVDVDNDPPVIHLRDSAVSVLPSDQVVDEAYALSRVYATDSGEELPQSSITVVITPLDWGYQFVYTARDNSGLTTVLSDTVTYPYYTISVTGDLQNSDLSSASLMQGVTLRDQSNRVMEGVNLSINITPGGGNLYRVVYSYTYASVLGTRTATATRNVYTAEVPTLAPSMGPAATASPEPMPTLAPQPTLEPTPEPTPEPAATQEPATNE